jgi:hypothetical protein
MIKKFQYSIASTRRDFMLIEPWESRVTHVPRVMIDF